MTGEGPVAPLAFAALACSFAWADSAAALARRSSLASEPWATGGSTTPSPPKALLSPAPLLSPLLPVSTSPGPLPLPPPPLDAGGIAPPTWDTGGDTPSPREWPGAWLPMGPPGTVMPVARGRGARPAPAPPAPAHTPASAPAPAPAPAPAAARGGEGPCRPAHSVPTGLGRVEAAPTGRVAGPQGAEAEAAWCCGVTMLGGKQGGREAGAGSAEGPLGRNAPPVAPPR